MASCLLFRTSRSLNSYINHYSMYSSYITNSLRNCTILSTPKSPDNSSPTDKPSASNITDRLTGTSSHSFIDIMNPSRVGKVTDITNTIATIDGFTSAKPYSIVEFDNGVRGLVLNVYSYGCKIGIIDNAKYNNKLLKVSDMIRLDKIENIDMKSPATVVGPGILGRIVDVFGNDFTDEPNDNNKNEKYVLPIYNVNLFPNSKYITHWNTYSRVRQRIHTGIKSIDTFYPFAYGLKTAIIGTNIHRKSELAIDILLSFVNHNQSTENMREKMFGIYVMIGKPVEEIWRLYNILAENGALEYCTIVVSRNDDLLCKQLLTPYSGAAMADFYKFYGMNSFIIYDDFTVHNRICNAVYCESLGLMNYGNWSGELLERSSQLNSKYGNGSLTSLCIADRGKTAAVGDDEIFYNYLPYLMSHVDQHIMLCDESFNNNLLPPISLFPVPYGHIKNIQKNEVLLKLSVNVKRILFQFVELESVARNQMELNIDLEGDIERIASKVNKLQVLFTQNEEIDVNKLILILLSINHKIVEYIHLDKIHLFENRLYEYFTPSNSKKWENVCEEIEKMGNKYDIDNADIGHMFHEFLDDNHDLCQPNALSLQNLHTEQS